MQTWNDRTLENEADFEIFDLLLKIDIKNEADSSKIVESLCFYGAFEAVKVRNNLTSSQGTVISQFQKSIFIVRFL